MKSSLHGIQMPNTRHPIQFDSEISFRLHFGMFFVSIPLSLSFCVFCECIIKIRSFSFVVAAALYRNNARIVRRRKCTAKTQKYIGIFVVTACTLHSIHSYSSASEYHIICFNNRFCFISIQRSMACQLLCQQIKCFNFFRVIFLAFFRLFKVFFKFTFILQFYDGSRRF